MPDPQDEAKPAEVTVAKPRAPGRRPSSAPKAPTIVLVVYLGAFAAPQAPAKTQDLEPAMNRRRVRASERFGKRLRPHEIAPLLSDPNDAEGKNLGAKIMLRSGLNLVDAKAWAVNAPPVKAGEKPATEIAKLVAGRQIVVLEELPKTAEAIIDLCERTVCLDALEALRLHEFGRRGGKNGEHARGAVLEAIDHRIATVKRRAKGPSSGPRLGAAEVKRRHARLRAS